MRQGDDLYFAPGIKFSEVQLDDPRFVDQLHARLDGLYLAPVRNCLEHKQWFAAGLLLIALIDFMSGMHRSSQELRGRRVRADFETYTQEKLSSSGLSDHAHRFYTDFRDGLTHQGMIKNAGEFSDNWPQTARVECGRLCINPMYLLREVEAALAKELKELRGSPTKRIKAANRLAELFAVELGIVAAAQGMG